MRTTLYLCTLLATLSASAQSNAPIDVTGAVLKGVDFFRAQALTNEDGWFFPPGYDAKVTGYTNRTVRLKEIEIIIPGYKYEPYEVLVPGRSPGDPMQRVTRQRVVGLDPSKNQKTTKEVSDPNGPIVREVQTAIYAKDTGCLWRYGGWGNNAWTILALRRCGVDGADPLVDQPAGNLASLVGLYGLPDYTYDLAGLTAAFAVMPGDDFKRLTEQCASKLLDAQLTTGPGTGLWGPVAFNPAMASAFLKLLTKLGDDKKALQNELLVEQRKTPGGKPSARAKTLSENIERINGRLGDLQGDVHRITQLGLLMYDSLGSPRRHNLVYLQYQGQRLGMEGLPYLVQNQIGADLDSTAVAVLALRVAFENGRLPLKTWRPTPPKQGGPGAPPSTTDFPPPRDTREILGLAAQRLNAARTADGQFPELNVHQAVPDFAWFKSLPQVKPDSIPKLAQPVTLASTVRGAATLANIQMIQTGAAKPTALEDAACRALLPDLYVGRPLANSNDVIRTPYNVLLQSTALRNLKGRCLRTDFNTWNEVADWLIGKQGKEGGWGRTSRWVFLPSTSLLALREALADMKPQDVANSYDKPHMSVGWLTPGHLLKYVEKEDAYFTAIALLFLADGLPEGWNPNTGR